MCGTVRTNGIESFWAAFKSGLLGTYSKVSTRHLMHFVAGRKNDGNCETPNRMGHLAGPTRQFLAWRVLSGRTTVGAAV